MTLPIRSIWTPHSDSRSVQVCKSLLNMRGEDWTWVNRPEEARWLVIDAERGAETGWSALLSEPGQRRHGIALAKSWAEVPSPAWTYFKLPLSPRGIFPWINQILELPLLAHVDKDLIADVTSAQWAGARLRLRRWPNLSIYPDPGLRLPELCRQMLSTSISFESLRQQFDDETTLLRLLDDAERHRALQVERPPPAATRPGANATAAEAAPKPPSLFQRFLSRFR
jgi:hypothetical protein